MIVSWNWLKEYVLLDMPVEELERRLMMAGLNHEATEKAGDDWAIDLEVTSNRPDCLGHLGIAREVAVLWNRELKRPAAAPREGKTPIGSLVKVRIDCPDLCARYTARAVRGAKIGPSPKWMTRRLEAIGITPINNVVDITNYVLMECGQPLHAFDLAKLEGQEIIVRRPLEGETIEAIDHKTYALAGDMCVIADARRAVAIGGVMGGASTEISAATRDILIEAAEFSPLSIRGTARKLNLHSDSSYRFERKIDPEGVDWASRRCCELILDLAGGELAEGVIDCGSPRPTCEPIVLRISQLKRILGIDVPQQRVREILAALGCEETAAKPADAASVCVVAPSWRRDLTREIDLVEEVARIHGYEQIPEDVGVPMVPSARTREDRVTEKVRQVLCAAGIDEAMTASLVDEATSQSMSPWTETEALRSQMSVLRGADRLRRSLVPSLLGARRTNESLSNSEIELFEIAKVYWPHGAKLPQEERMIAITSGRGYAAVKGVVEAIVAALRPAAALEAGDAGIAQLNPLASCVFRVGGEMLGYVGELTAEGLKQFDLRGPTTVAELKLAPLVEAALLVPRYAALPAYPAVERDLNLVVDEAVRWADIAATVRTHCGPYFEGVEYRDTWRDENRLGAGKKSLLLTVSLRWREGTMTNQQADEVRDQIVAACRRQYAAELRA